MNLDHKQLDRLLATLADSDIQEFCLEGKDFRLEIKRNLPSSSLGNLVNSSSSSQQAAPVVAPQIICEPGVDVVSTASTGNPPPASSNRGEFVEITAPMVGTFYASSNPDSPAFIKVGDSVGKDTTVCIVEAMKVFNEIPAEISGKIVAVLVNDQDPVDCGKPMFKVDTRG